MSKFTSSQTLVDIIHQLHDGLINFSEAKLQAYEIFHDEDTPLDEDLFNTALPVFVEYFLDPVKKSRTIIQEKAISKSELLAGHRFIRESKLAKKVFLSHWYPRSLLVKSAANLLNFMQRNPQYLPKILRGETVGPMMLEIHPTNATCIYRCQMCIWCGGQQQKGLITDFYGAERLLTTDQWCEILEETKELGTRQIIFSGGGETMLSPTKIMPVLEKANSIGLETMIYTNGRTLYDANPTLLDSVLKSTWLRVSLHAATPEIYARLINRPLGADDLEYVLNGVRKIISLKKQRASKLKVGIGVVLQELNYAEVPNIVRLCSDLELDFLDLRMDCIGITNTLSVYQYEQMLSSLRELRARVENGELTFDASFADDLLIAMDRWEGIRLTSPKRCLIPVVRPAIDPFGIVGACDSIGEPYTRSLSPREYVLGKINNGCDFTNIMRSSAGKKLGIRCKNCMPGQISLNALLEKMVDDLKIGIEPTEQPFSFKNN